jgi:hypothetical protein
MKDDDPNSSPAMGVANMLRLHVLPAIIRIESVEPRARLMELYDSMIRDAIKAHYEGKR